MSTPDDLLPQRAGHGDGAGCECDLEGGDPDCKVLPPYESTVDYCQRLRTLVKQLEARLQTLQTAYDQLAGTCEVLTNDVYRLRQCLVDVREVLLLRSCAHTYELEIIEYILAEPIGEDKDGKP